MNTIKRVNPVEIYAGTAWQAGMVKRMLEDSEIEAFLIDQIMGTMHPWYTAPVGSGSVKVFVSSSDYHKAKSIVDNFEENAMENT
jgi:hypothetical protein